MTRTGRFELFWPLRDVVDRVNSGAMNLYLDISALESWCSAQALSPLRLLAVDSMDIPGGFGTRQMFRHVLTCALSDGTRRSFSVVHKYGTPVEVRVMQALSAIPGLKSVQGALCSGADWFVSPWHEGRLLTFDDPMPLAVVGDLARIHVYFESRLQECAAMEGMEQVDGAFFGRFVGYALTALDELVARDGSAVPARLREDFGHACQSGVFEAALARLPLTLVHGDVHPGNMIATDAGQVALIDWGNARLGPALLDILNLVDRGTPEWDAYMNARAGRGGAAIGAHELELHHEWARAMIKIQYLPYACGHLPDWVPDMLRTVIDAHDALLALAAEPQAVI